MAIVTWGDLFFTSEGCLTLTVYGFVAFVAFCLFGPAPLDERKMEMESEWAAHEKRGKHFQKRGADESEPDR